MGKTSMRALFVVMVGLIVTAGCSARIEAAKNKLLKKIDQMVGEMDVKRTEIGNSIVGLREGIDGLAKANIRATVKLEQVGREVEPAQQSVTRIDKALKVIRPYFDKKESVEIAGTSYSPEKLQEMAAKMLNERKTRVATLDGLQQARSALEKTVATLQDKEDKYKASLTRLEGQVAEIDAKMIAAKAMKEASVSMGDSDQSLSGNVTNLEAKIKDLFVDVEVAIRSEGEKWDQAATAKQIDTVDTMLTKLEGPASTVAEIDKILGKAQ